jgi:hypothetical protein
VLDYAFDTQFTSGETGFAPTIYSLVGLDFDEHLVSAAHPYGVRLDI